MDLVAFPALLALLPLGQIRYMVCQFRSVRWPVTDATMQKGFTGFVPIGDLQDVLRG